MDTALFRIIFDVNYWGELSLKNELYSTLDEYSLQFAVKYLHLDWIVGKIVAVHFPKFNLVDVIFLPVGKHMPRKKIEFVEVNPYRLESRSEKK